MVRDRDRAAGSRSQVAEIGCGSGRITAYLAGLGLDAFGVDLSPAMVEEARRRHPGLEFRIGDMTALDLPSGSLAGLVAWYSVIHVPPAGHPAVFAGFRRVVAPGGHLLLAFQVGDERRHLTEAYGHTGLSCDAYRLPPEWVEQQAVAAGFRPVARLVREPFGAEKTAQAYLVLRVAAASDDVSPDVKSGCQSGCQSAKRSGKPPVATGPQRRGVTRIRDLPCFTMASRYSSQSGWSPAMLR